MSSQKQTRILVLLGKIEPCSLESPSFLLAFLGLCFGSDIIKLN